MKINNYKLLIYAVSILAVVGGVISCKPASSYDYKKFVGPNEIVYAQKLDTVIARSGDKRVVLKMARSTDPLLWGVGVYWNNQTDSVKVKFPTAKDTLRVQINNLDVQGTYTFHIYTYHKNYTDKSIGQNVSVTVYGNVYASSIKNRKLVAIVPTGKNAVLVKWGSAGIGALGTIFKYTNVMENIDSLYVPIDSAQTHINNISGMQKDSTLKFYTLYQPPASIDTFYTATIERNLYNLLPPSNLALHKKIVDKSSDCSCGRVSNVTDGDLSTFWQPLHSDRSDGKIWFTVDLGSTFNFNKIVQYWVKGEDQFTGYKILYSNDNKTWKTAYVSTTGVSAKEVATFPAVKGRYVKLIILINSFHSERMAEFEVHGLF